MSTMETGKLDLKLAGNLETPLLGVDPKEENRCPHETLSAIVHAAPSTKASNDGYLKHGVSP